MTPTPPSAAIHARLDALRDFHKEGPKDGSVRYLSQLRPKLIAKTLDSIYTNTQRAQNEEGKMALKNHPSPESE